MPWKTMDVREQRVKFVVAASRREKPFNHLCLEFGTRPGPDGTFSPPTINVSQNRKRLVCPSFFERGGILP